MSSKQNSFEIIKANFKNVIFFIFCMNVLSDDDRHLSFGLLRRSYVILFFFVFAFFGVGNIASVNSFDVRIVLPFITVFKPFVMGALLAYKVL